MAASSTCCVCHGAPALVSFPPFAPLAASLPVVIAACDDAIEDGTNIGGEWLETGYTDGGIDWSWHEREVMTETALSLLPIRRDLRMVLELLERIDDLIAAQRAVAEL